MKKIGIMMLFMGLVGCENNSGSVDVPEEERMLCLNVGSTIKGYMRKCEDKKFICYTHSESLFCFKK